MTSRHFHKISGQYKQFCSFSLSDTLFGIDIRSVKEIKDEYTYTPVYHAPIEIKGLVNIRGQINLILDLRLMFDMKPRPKDQSSHLILIKHLQESDPYGIEVDRHCGVVEVADENIEYFKEDGLATFDRFPSRQLTLGVCKLEDNLMIILNTDKMLSTIHNS